MNLNTVNFNTADWNTKRALMATMIAAEINVMYYQITENEFQHHEIVGYMCYFDDT